MVELVSEQYLQLVHLGTGREGPGTRRGSWLGNIQVELAAFGIGEVGLGTGTNSQFFCQYHWDYEFGMIFNV